MTVNGISAEIEVIRSKRKTLSAEISPDGKVIVRAPMKLANRSIEAFLQEKSAVIEKHLKKRIEENRVLSEIRPYTDDEIRCMTDEAAVILKRRTEYYAGLMGLSYNRITVRRQKTRWGSCTAKGNLNFNCLLVMTPPEVLDSVVVHELCHLVHRDHSKEFYSMVFRYFPDYKRCDRWLKEYGRLLIRRMTGE